MADTAARLALSARRNEVARFTIAVNGIDLTGVAMAMQVRQTVDNPYLLFALGTVSTLAAEGLKLDSVTVTNGVPTSIIKGRINASTMTDATKVPYIGEIGEDSPLAYAMQWTLNGDAQTRLYGDFIVVASAFGSDGAPTNRPPSYGAQSFVTGSSGGSLTFGDQIVSVTVAGAELLSPLVASTQIASAAAQQAAGIAGGFAASASESSAFAEEFSGPAYDSVAAGQLAMTSGQFFRVSNGDTPRTYTRYQRTSGGSTVAAPLATTVGLANGTAYAAARPSRIALLSTAGLQAMATSMDTDRLSAGFIPTFDQDLTVTSTITVAQPGRVYGDSAATYNRGPGKKGWLEAANGIGRMFDLGASRTFTTGSNGADHWMFDGLKLRQATGTTARTVDGISFTSRTDGPDRGAIIRNVAIRGMRDAITVENPDLSTNLASLSLDACVLVANEKILNAKGRLLGLSITNCQLEQNLAKTGTDEGIISGSVDGPVYICTNMAEGQSNFLDIKNPVTFGNSPKVKVAYNYFEANAGDYVMRFACSTSRGHFDIGPNYTHNITAKDYVVFTGAGTMFVDMFDDFPVTFDNSSATLKYGSNILRNRQSGYKVRRVGATAGSKSTEVVISDYQNLREASDNPHIHAVATAGTVMSTPYGERLCATLGSQLIGIQLPVAVGDFVEVNVLMRAAEIAAGNFQVNVFADDGTTPVFSWTSSGIPLELAGKWALVSLAGISQAASTRLRIGMRGLSGTYDYAIVGASARNHGVHVNDGSAFKLVRPVMPKMLAAEQTGWIADTGTAKKSTNASYAPGTALTFSAAYAQSEHTALATRLASVEAALRDSTQAMKALKDALIAAGTITV